MAADGFGNAWYARVEEGKKYGWGVFIWFCVTGFVILEIYMLY